MEDNLSPSNLQPPPENQATPPSQNPLQDENKPHHLDTKSIIVILLLVFVYPVGVILMFFWMKHWPKWLRIIIGIPLILLIVGVIGIAILAFIAVKDPKGVQKSAENLNKKNVAIEFVNASVIYALKNDSIPCDFPQDSPGQPLSSLPECVDNLISSDDLKPGFRTSPFLGDINVYFDKLNGSLYACIKGVPGCEIGVIGISLPSVTPSPVSFPVYEASPFPTASY